MSEGTADQLFLALRLAFIERHAQEQQEPIVVVLDDILVQFNDERSRAALSVLGDLAARVQTLFFTHHARLLEPAAELPPQRVLKVHHLRN